MVFCGHFTVIFFDIAPSPLLTSLLLKVRSLRRNWSTKSSITGINVNSTYQTWNLSDNLIYWKGKSCFKFFSCSGTMESPRRKLWPTPSSMMTSTLTSVTAVWASYQSNKRGTAKPPITVNFLQKTVFREILWNTVKYCHTEKQNNKETEKARADGCPLPRLHSHV